MSQRICLPAGPFVVLHQPKSSLLDFGTECDSHAHFDDLPWQLCAEVSWFRTKGDASPAEHGALTVTQASSTGAFLWTDLNARSAYFTTGFCGGRALAQGIEVVDDTEMEDVTADGVVEYCGIEFDKAIVWWVV